MGRLVEAGASEANEHKLTLMLGRTHGVHAEPTTFGLKCALWYAELKRNVARFRQAASDVEFGKLSGAVGTFAHIPPEVEARTCELLGIQPAPIRSEERRVGTECSAVW